MMGVNKINYGSLAQALKLVDEGVTKKIELNKNLKVYAVGENVIRIDIKKEVK
jgi:hypothetical protein